MIMDTEASNLCYGCLAGDRKMHLIKNKLMQQCFFQIIRETITLPNVLSLWLCWECEAYITRFTKFKLQVKKSYQILHKLTKQDELTPLHQKFSIRKVVDITLSPNIQNETGSATVAMVKTEKEDPEFKITTQIKYETDYSEDDDKFLIDLSNKTKKKKNKLKRNSKVKVKKKQSIFREIELSDEQIGEERNDLALRDDYVNAMFRCHLCIVSFPNEDDMKDHVWKKHELHASKHKCSLCQCSFSTEVAYNYHRRRHVRRYECTLCNVKCASKVAVKNHYSSHYQSASFDLGYKTYKNTEAFNEDNSGTKSEDKFPCEYCPKVFGWKTSLRKHLETHKIEAGQKRRPYCEPCRLSFTTTSNLQKHVKTSSKHQIQLKLRKLKESNPQPDTMNDAQIADIKTLVNRQRELYPCEQCDKKFQWRGNLLRHLHSHAARANGELVCTPCNRTFSSIATYKQHMKISKKHASENDFKYMCSDCGKRFANKTKLKDHVDWEHLKNYVHTCSDCHKVFKSHTSLYLHRQVVHRCVSAEHLCENCGKAFPNQTKLRSHIIALHTREAPYKCGTCGARFSWHSCLSRHLRRVHRDK